MACRLGSLFFCADCAALLDAVSASPFVKCSQCGRSYDADQLDGGVITTSASFRAVDRRKEQGEGPQTRARINETCPSCGHEELTFYTMQLRSADEGSTVFYECEKCNHKFSVNN